jgi:hypothetical protein
VADLITKTNFFMSNVEIELRFKKLEKSNRMYKILFLNMLLLCGFFVFVSFSQDNTEDLIRAKEIQIINSNGNIALSLKSNRNAGQLDIQNGAGSRILTLTESDGGSGGTIVARDQYGNKIYRMVPVTGGGGSIESFNKDGYVATQMSVTDRNTGYIAANYGDGRQMAVVSYANSSGSGIFSIFNNSGYRISVIGADPANSGCVNVYDSYGNNLNGVWPK